MKSSSTLQSTNMAEKRTRQSEHNLQTEFPKPKIDPEGNTCPQLRKFCLGGQKLTREEGKGFLSTPKWLPTSTIASKLFLILFN